MAKKNRMEQIRKVRSLNDLMVQLKDVESEVNSGGKQAARMFTSLSAVSRDETIVIQHQRGGKIRRIKTATKSKLNFTGKIDNFKAPAAAGIQKHNKVLQKLYDNAKELDSIESVLRQQFSGVKAQPAALKAVVELRRYVDSSIQTALTGLNKVAVKNFPNEMEEMRDALTSFLINTVPEDQYKDLGYLEYVSVGERNSTIFSVYVELDSLQNNNGFTFDEYFIIMTGVVDVKGNVAYYINALPDFKVPGSYPLGKQVSSENEMEAQVGLLLAHNDVITDFERAPMPFADSDDVNKRGFGSIGGVISAKVADDALHLEVSKTDKKKDTAIVKETQAMLNSVMRRKKDANISWKSVVKGSKRYLVFILYFKPGSAPQSLNLAKLGEIASTLDLNHTQMQKLRRSLLD